MSLFLDPPLIARQGGTLIVLAICRISTIHQDEKSLADQEAYYRRWIEDRWNGPYELVVIASTGSGESLDREEYLRAIAHVESGKFHLVIMEDLGRICRRVHAHIFCETCEDSDTRLVAINDFVDTAREDWRLGSFFAVMRHESYNRDTSNRIRRSHRNRFSEGGVFQCPIFGYVKAPEAKTDAEVAKDPAAEIIFAEWFRRLDNGASFAEIGDWLNRIGILTGPFCRGEKWDGRMVGRITHNPLLKGLRVRNDKKSKRVNKTGRRHSVRAPTDERLERYCPHLAFFASEYYDRVVQKVDLRNANYRRKGINGVDTRKGVSKKRTIWPGQHLRCGVCGRYYYWSGVTSKKAMMCSGAHAYSCWNSCLLNGDLAQRKLAEAIMTEIRNLPGYDETLIALVRDRMLVAQADGANRRQDLERRLEDIVRQIARATDAIVQMEGSRALTDKLRELEAEKAQLEMERREMENVPQPESTLPSLETIKQKAADIFDAFEPNDLEVGRLMQRLIPDLRVFPVRLCDGGAVELRARFTLYLTSLVPSSGPCAEMDSILRKEMAVDLFDPPQRVIYRERVMTGRASGKTEQEVAKALGITHTAAQRAASLDRLMKKQGIMDPYVPIAEPPADYGKLRRHKHPRYSFKALEASKET